MHEKLQAPTRPLALRCIDTRGLEPPCHLGVVRRLGFVGIHWP
jgi:hypothetical protein